MILPSIRFMTSFFEQQNWWSFLRLTLNFFSQKEKQLLIFQPFWAHTSRWPKPSNLYNNYSSILSTHSAIPRLTPFILSRCRILLNKDQGEEKLNSFQIQERLLRFWSQFYSCYSSFTSNQLSRERWRQWTHATIKITTPTPPPRLSQRRRGSRPRPSGKPLIRSLFWKGTFLFFNNFLKAVILFSWFEDFMASFPFSGDLCCEISGSLLLLLCFLDLHSCKIVFLNWIWIDFLSVLIIVQCIKFLIKLI